MLVNSTTSIYVTKVTVLNDEQIKKINKIDTLESNLNTVNTNLQNQKNNYDSKIAELENSQIENLNDAIRTLESILKYDDVIGDSVLNTENKTLTGAINEINDKIQ